MSSVSRDDAVGTITLQWILFFLPSIANVLFKPTSPIFAALQQKQTGISTKNCMKQPLQRPISLFHSNFPTAWLIQC